MSSKIIYTIPLFYIFKYIYFYYFNNEKDNINWLKSKIESLEENIHDLHESIDNLEKNVEILNSELHESNIKLNNFIESNYDIIEKK